MGFYFVLTCWHILGVDMIMKSDFIVGIVGIQGRRGSGGGAVGWLPAACSVVFLGPSCFGPHMPLCVGQVHETTRVLLPLRLGDISGRGHWVTWFRSGRLLFSSCNRQAS